MFWRSTRIVVWLTIEQLVQHEKQGKSSSALDDPLVRYFGWPQVSQTAREKPLPCVSPFASDREANTKPIGLGPLPTTPLYKRGSTYRISKETLPIRLVRALEGSEARVPTAGATGVNQKATAAEETPLHYTDRRHRLHQLRPARWIPPLPGIRSNWPIPHYFQY
jgi:cytochrome oxidase assembly protein ShyY1